MTEIPSKTIHSTPKIKHGLKKLTISVATTPFGRWLVIKFISRADVWLAHQSKGRISFANLAGLPLLVLTSKGAKSGRLRQTALLYLKDENRVIVIASRLGSRRHPHWYYNLTANPEASLFFEGKSGAYLSREAAGKERQVYWESMVELFPGYDRYKKLAGGRLIPVMVFSPLPTD